MRVVINVDEIGPSVPRCAVCESPYGEPHKADCNCTLYEMVSVEDYEDDELKSTPAPEAEQE